MLAVLFPGQGSHTADDRAVVARHAPDLLDRVVDLVGTDPFGRQAESTAYAQPAIFCTSLARFRAAPPPGHLGALAGHSLGELSALAAAGALDVDDALRLVVERGRLMAEADEGGMLVVKAGVEDVADLARASGVVVANDNAPHQVVLSGAEDAIEDARWRCRVLGLRAMRLDVTGAFHSPLMADAAAAFTSALAEVEVREPRVPVLCCATAAPFTDVRVQLAQALTAPVRWREVLLALDAMGATTYADAGPGRVLANLVPKTLEEAGDAVLA